MSIPRVARIHLVYQFIILTLLVFAIGYNEILPDKKYLFLALIPVFCYQLIIVFCCTELLPLPCWLIWTDVPINCTSEQDIKTESPSPILSETVEAPKESLTISKNVPSRQRLPCKYNFKNKETDAETGEEISNSLAVTSQPSLINKETSFAEVNANHPPVEFTKSYYFPHRQKRLEEWLEPKENVRPYKVRNWNSVHGYQNSKSLPNQKSPIVLIEKCEETNILSKRTEKSSETEEIDVNDLTKSYSFPFRRKKLEKWVESDESENDLNIPVMPPWKALNYCSAYNRDGKRRKSVSTEAIDKELRLIKSRCQQSENDFSQSVELPGPVDLDVYVAKKNFLKPTTNFSRLKQGLANCFNRNKKENFKTDDNKQNGESKKQFFKELFTSKESLILEPEKKEESTIKFKISNFASSDGKGKLINRSPSYVSFANDSFGKEIKAKNSCRKEDD